MKCSVESRVPFLTTEMADLAFSLDERLLIADDGTSKAVLREALRGLVPQEILDRRDKVGFKAPDTFWLRQISPWVERVMASPAMKTSFLDKLVMRTHWGQVLAGRANLDGPFWRALCALAWAEKSRLDFNGLVRV